MKTKAFAERSEPQIVQIRPTATSLVAFVLGGHEALGMYSNIDCLYFIDCENDEHEALSMFCGHDWMRTSFFLFYRKTFLIPARFFFSG